MNRHGSIYIMVLITSAFVLATGLAALSLGRRVTDRGELIDRVGSARVAVRTGLDLAVQMVVDDPGWRSTIGGDGLYLIREIDAGDSVHTVRVYAESDGDISDDDLTDPFTLRVVASQTDTRRLLEVEIQPVSMPVDILDFGAYSASNVESGSQSYVNGDAGVAAASDFLGTGATFFVPVETEGLLSDATYTSSTLEGAPAREFVPEEDMISIYEPYGTVVSEGNLFHDGSTYLIEGLAIGPGLNPLDKLEVFRTGDVYIIEHGSQDIVIRDSRILATILFVGSGNVILEESVNWEPATPGWPTIVTDSDVVFRMTSDSLSESVLLTNFNPIDLGDAKASGDIDLADFYPSQIEGIVYTRGRVLVESGVAKIVGHVVSKGDLVISPRAILELRTSRDSTDNTPPGFGSAIRFEMIPTRWLDP